MYRNCINEKKILKRVFFYKGSLIPTGFLIALLVTLVTAFFVPATSFAQPTLTDAKICETLGVLKGTGRGVTDEYLASSPQRYQAARLFLRLQGLEEEAVRYAGSANFSDVKAMADWQFAPENKAVLAYLYDHPELGFIGYPDGTYKPFNRISAMEYYKVILTALGYKQGVDFEWGEDMLAFAESKGLYEAARVSEFTIANLATATREALVAEVKGTGKTLLETLVEKGVIDKNAALSTGIYREPVLEVKNVVADNLAEILISFNLELDGDSLKPGWFTVDGKEPVSAILTEDRMTVKIDVDKEKIGGNGATYKVQVLTDACAANGATLKEEYETSIRIIDTTPPGIRDIQLTGPQTIELVFSEPIKTKGTVRINNGTYGCRVEDITGVTNRVEVFIHHQNLPEGGYDLDISGFADYAGFSMDGYKHTLSYRKDTSLITAKITEAGQTTVKIMFNKAVTLKAGEEKSYFYHTFPMWNPSSVLTDDKTSYTLKFTTHPIQTGTTKLTIKASGESGIFIEDLWGNKLQSDIVLPLTVSADNTAPEVKGQIEVKDQNSIEISFTEDVAGADDKENYTIEDYNGNKIDINTISYDSINYRATIHFSEDLTGTYTIIIKNITDTSAHQNVMKETVLSFYVKDMTPPDHAKVEVTAIDRTGSGFKDVIYVRYPEEMAVSGEYSVLKTDNYLLGGIGLPDGTELDLFGPTGRVVRITLPDASQVITGKMLTIGRVADAAGNIMQSLAVSVTVSQEAPPKVTEAVQTAANKIRVTVDKILQSVEPEAFVFTIPGKEYKASGIERYYYEEGTTIVEVILSAEFMRELKDKNTNYGYDSGLLATDISGVKLKIVGRHIVSETGMIALDISDLGAGDAVKGIAPMRVRDGWNPSLRAITVVNDVFVDTPEFSIRNDENKYDTVITIDFTEIIAGEDSNMYHYYAHDLIIMDNSGNTLTPAIDYVTYVNAGDIVVVIPDVRIPLGASGGKYTIRTADTIVYIEDTAGNKINAFGSRNIE